MPLHARPMPRYVSRLVHPGATEVSPSVRQITRTHCRRQYTTRAPLLSKQSHTEQRTTSRVGEKRDVYDRTLQTTFTTVMRTLPGPVCVITASASCGPSHEKDQTLRLEVAAAYTAITASSLTSLSLTPSVLITFNIRSPSRTLAALGLNPKFNVHVLASDAAGARIAHTFAQPREFGEQVGRLKDGGMNVDIDVDQSRTHPPRLVGQGVQCVLGCEQIKSLEVQDHAIVVGRVVDISGCDRDAVALSYAQGRYRGPGNIIDFDTVD